ncbi:MULTISPECIES: putative phage tail protein [unclassified Streptomyces]|uniref:putative phage tail protein n=1 Tax=unclassified Streptomyces TaxID=2593676 RepID=UPI00363F7692
MPKVIIHNLEVRMQVDGDDGAVFTRLFNKHIQAWAKLYEDECARTQRTAAERGFGDGEGRP